MIYFCRKKYYNDQAAENNQKYFQHFDFYALKTNVRSVNKLRFDQKPFSSFGPPTQTLVTLRKSTFGRSYKLIDPILITPGLRFQRLCIILNLCSNINNLVRN